MGYPLEQVQPLDSERWSSYQDLCFSQDLQTFPVSYRLQLFWPGCACVCVCLGQHFIIQTEQIRANVPGVETPQDRPSLVLRPFFPVFLLWHSG